MPYSFEKKIEKKIENKIQKLTKQFDEETDDIWNKSINKTFEELYEESVNMYDALIEEYYKYKTSSYYRHHVGVGTGTGENLYYGKQFDLSHGYIPQLSIRFSGKDMDGYKNSSTDEILSNVLHGIRGVPSKGWWTTWNGSYNGKYFSVGGVDVVTAFNIFEENFGHLSRYIFKEKINEEKKTGRYQFYK